MTENTMSFVGCVCMVQILVVYAAIIAMSITAAEQELIKEWVAVVIIIIVFASAPLSVILHQYEVNAVYKVYNHCFPLQEKEKP